MLFPEELRTRRVELNLSQETLAGRLLVSQQTVSRWEGGASLPGPRRIGQLAEALDLDLPALLRSAGYVLVSEVTADSLAPTVEELGRMTTSDLVQFIDAGWQHLRRRLVSSSLQPAAIE